MIVRREGKQHCSQVNDQHQKRELEVNIVTIRVRAGTRAFRLPPQFRKAENAASRQNKLYRKIGVEYQQADANHGEVQERNVPDTLISLRDHPLPEIM
jgi:hypothetical protein